MTKTSNGSIFGKFLGGIGAAGTVWRETIAPSIDRLNDRIKDGRRQADELASTTRSYLKTSFSGADGKLLKDQWGALQLRLQQGASDAISNVRGITAVSWETLSGLHPSIGLALLELYRIERLAATKLATEASELVSAKEYFDALRLKVENDGKAELTADLEHMNLLLTAAREAVARMPSSESEVRRLFIAVTGMVEETGRVAKEYDQKVVEYIGKFGKDAVREPIEGSPLGDIKGELTNVAPLVRSATPMQAAVQLSNLNWRLTTLQTRYLDLVNKFAADNQTLRSLEGTMNTMVSDAQMQGHSNDPQLLAAGRAFIKATRTAPFDLAEAGRQKDAYITRLDTLLFPE